MREIFSQREAIVVYATTDPMEALSLGGNTAVLDRGRLIQYGVTPTVYHQPATVPVTQVFSDPPMNLLPGVLDDGQLRIAGGDAITAPAHLRELPPGSYRIGIRPVHVSVSAPVAECLTIRGEVDVAEVAGSETFIHMSAGDNHWVVQQPGVHVLPIGKTLDVHVESRHLFAYGSDDQLMAAPTRRLANAG